MDNRLFGLRSPELAEKRYSGGAVFSEKLGAVVAIQTEATNTRLGAGRDTVLAMPLYRVAHHWKALRELARGKKYPKGHYPVPGQVYPKGHNNNS